MYSFEYTLVGFELNKDFWLNINDDDLLKRKIYVLYYFLAEYVL